LSECEESRGGCSQDMKW